MKDYFLYKGKKYYKGTVVQVHEAKREKFGFLTTLKFIGCDENGVCFFTSLYDAWERYNMHSMQLDEYIEKICLSAELQTNDKPKVNPNHIDGMISAWTWYLLIMFFAIFIKGVSSILMVCGMTTYIFFNWRKRKMNGEE